jgi:hypothetical protein
MAAGHALVDTGGEPDARGSGITAGPSTASQPAPADAAPVAITARIRPDPSHVGDLLELEVVAAYPRDVRVNMPSVLDLSPLHLVGVHESQPEATGEGLRKTFTITLQHFEVGEAEVPSFSLTYVTVDGQVHSVDVPPMPFVVASLLANENDPTRKLEDPPISLEYPNELAEIVAYSILGTLLAALLAWVLARRFWGREKVVVAPPPIPPHELALAALEELASGELVEKGRFADYYLQLTEIAKGYLEGRFGVEALDRTTEEIRVELSREPGRLEPLSVDEVVRFLQACDLVKFARFRPDADEAAGALAWVRTTVERTMARPEVRKTTPSTRLDEAAEAEVEPEGEGEAAVGSKTPPSADDDPRDAEREVRP